MLRDSASAVAAYTTAHQPNAYSPSQSALDRCTTDEVPILRLLERPCPAGFHGFGCDVRWDLQDQFLPKPRRWLNQFNRSRRADVDCQRAFFDAFATLLTRIHWEQEWDAQPYAETLSRMALSGDVDVRELPSMVARSHQAMLVTFSSDNSLSHFPGFLFG